MALTRLSGLARWSELGDCVVAGYECTSGVVWYLALLHRVTRYTVLRLSSFCLYSEFSSVLAQRKSILRDGVE